MLRSKRWNYKNLWFFFFKSCQSINWNRKLLLKIKIKKTGVSNRCLTISLCIFLITRALRWHDIPVRMRTSVGHYVTRLTDVLSLGLLKARVHWRHKYAPNKGLLPLTEWIGDCGRFRQLRGFRVLYKLLTRIGWITEKYAIKWQRYKFYLFKLKEFFITF